MDQNCMFMPIMGVVDSIVAKTDEILAERERNKNKQTR